MPKLAAVVAVVALVLACGGSKKDPDRPGDGSDAGGGAGSGSAVTDGGGSGGGGAPATGAVTRAECEAMVVHIMDIGVAEQPEAKRPTPEAVETAKQNMIKSEKDMQECMAFDRAIHTCVMAAKTVAAIGACLEQ